MVVSFGKDGNDIDRGAAELRVGLHRKQTAVGADDSADTSW